MKSDDTEIGGVEERFPVTRLSAIRALQSADDRERQRGFEVLVAAYWKPVYKHLRWKWHATPEDAKDLTQSFFARALEKDFFERFDPDKASFRTFVRTCVDGFASNERKAAQRQKRGGGQVPLSLDFEAAEDEFQTIDVPSSDDVQQHFHREWVRSLFELAIGELRRRYEASGRTVHLRLFEAYDLEGDDAQPRTTYEELARRHHIAVTQVTNYLSLVRRDFRALVLENLRAISGSEEEFRTEAAALLGKRV